MSAVYILRPAYTKKNHPQTLVAYRKNVTQMLLRCETILVLEIRRFDQC